jgi:glycosyltransferase involved in cell wall biosynthesis
MTKLRLALIAHRFQHNDGQGRVNYEVARAALNSGHLVTLVAAHCAEELSKHPGAHFVRLGKERRPTQLLRNLAFASDSAHWVREHRIEFDLIQANGFITWEPCDIVTAHFVHGAWARHPFYPFRSLWRPYHLYQRAFTALNARWEKQAFHRARLIIAVSETVAHEIQQCGIPAEKIEVIYNGVDTEENSPGPPDRASFGLPMDVPLALFVGEIRTPRKNLDTLLKALKLVDEVHLAVAGETKNSPYPELARSLGLQSRVHFLGKTHRIGDLMRSVDFFVFPSRYEAHPLVVLEAMASALPIIISSNVGAAQSFTGVLTVLQDPESEKELSGHIMDLLRSPARMAHMGEAARRRALDLKWSHTVEKYLLTYQALSFQDDRDPTICSPQQQQMVGE